jgi:hypothetical protein
MEMPEMAEMRSWPYRWCRTGVCPTGLQVLRTEGIKRKPDSSTKTRWAASLAALFYPGPDESFPFGDGRLVALQGSTFRLLVAPAQLVQELAHVIAMVSHAKMTLDYLDNSLGGPQLGSVPMRQGPFGQKTNQLLLLLRGQPGWSTRSGLGFQGILSARPHRIPPPENTAGVATYAPGDFMKGELLFEEVNRTPSAFSRDFGEP